MRDTRHAMRDARCAMRDARCAMRDARRRQADAPAFAGIGRPSFMIARLTFT
jgi:hypothetical protein